MKFDESTPIYLQIKGEIEKGAQKKLKAKTYDEFIEADLRNLISKSRSFGVSKLDIVKLSEIRWL